MYRMAKWLGRLGLQRFLDMSGSALVWRILGEKRAFGPGDWREAWAGFLRLTGASSYGSSGLKGYLHTSKSSTAIDFKYRPRSQVRRSGLRLTPAQEASQELRLIFAEYLSHGCLGFWAP